MSLAATTFADATVPDRKRDRALIRMWLYGVAALIAAMVVVGGATRLTHSGLSITEWQPIHGVIPPLSTGDWQDEFAKYQQIPEYRELNQGMSLEAFKTLFWWEWSHRLLGRVIGFAVALPLLAFWAMGRIERRLVPQIVAMLVLGGLQGAVGWWMVASGLEDRTDVSQYRLATHLVLACIIFAYVLWVARGLAPARADPPPAGVRRRSSWLIGLVFLQIYLGALVAGLDAGFTFNTWPLMDGGIVPAAGFADSPLWRNFFENVATVQFDHRLVAYAVFIFVVTHAVLTWRASPGTVHARGALFLAGVVLCQAALGIATLLLVVPIPLALAHQFGAVAVLATAVAHRRAMSAPVPMTAPAPVVLSTA